MSKFAGISDEELRQELERRKQFANWSPVANWSVTTEGDCEGKTIKQLGAFSGHIVDIAKSLAPQAYYGLSFKRNGELPKCTEDKKVTVEISLDIETGTWDMNKQDRVNTIRKFLGKEQANSNYHISDGRYYACVRLDIE